jgi:anaerobic magnesium-protoporphyrin IX monomethyl ester cyclase
MPPLSCAAIIVPPLRDFYFTRHRFSSLGAHIVKRLVEKHGISATLFNFPLLRPRGTSLSLPPDLDYLRPLLIENETGGTSFFTRFRRYGPDTQTCAKLIADSNPDICFFSVFAYAYADDALECADKVKLLLPNVPIVMGGGGPSGFPEYFLSGSVDYVLTGEAEVSIPQFLQDIASSNPDLKRVPNLWWRQDGIIKRSSERLFTQGNNIEIVFQKTAESSHVITWSTSITRGCPMDCTFCSSHLALGKELRTPSTQRFQEALSSINNGCDYEQKQLVINIEDDNLLADNSYARSVFSAIQSNFPRAEIIMENGIDYRFLTPEKTEWLIKNGMKKFNISLGSLDPEILRSRNRVFSLEKFEAILNVLDRYRIPSVTYFICGFAEDTPETVVGSLRYLANRNTTIGISSFYAVPGLGDNDNSLIMGKPSLLCLGSACYPWNGSLSTETLVTAFRLARYINLTKDSNRSEIEDQLIDKIKDTRLLHTLVKDKGSNVLRIVHVERQDKDLVRRFLDSPG